MAKISDLCGWGPSRARTLRQRATIAMREADGIASRCSTPFRSLYRSESGAGKSVRLDLPVQKVTRKPPYIAAQLTGDCVARAAMQCIHMRSCQEIADGQAEVYKAVNSSYHYATGRVIVGKNRLKGDAGSIGGWQAESLASHGVVAEDQVGIQYSKGLADSWGDDKAYNGKKFRDFISDGESNILESWARVTTWEEMRTALYNGCPIHICSMCGYKGMKPGRDGFHKPEGSWPHAMTVYAYWENTSVNAVAIINSWGDVHGRVKDPLTGEPLPPGTILVRLSDFQSRHFTRDSECIAFKMVEGFTRNIDVRGWF